MNGIKKSCVCLLLAVTLATGNILNTAAAYEGSATQKISEIKGGNGLPYSEYISAYHNAADATAAITLRADGYTEAEGDVQPASDGGLNTGSDSTVTWKFAVASARLYGLEIDYFPMVSKGGNIERTILVDGKQPFSEAGFIEFSRVYQDGEIKTNAKGNEITPEQLEKPRKLTYIFRDTNTFIEENLYLYLESGEHTITLRAEKEQLELYELRFTAPDRPISYSQYISQYKNSVGENVQPVIVEAEKPIEKSSFTVYPTSDKSSSATYPQDPVKTRLNMISGEKWGKPGQWLTWEFAVEKSGLYYIVPRYKQDSYAGGFVSRKLYIDGKLPFSEAAHIKFNYADSWKTEPLGGAEPYSFYLEEGKHTFTLEVVLGEMSDIIGSIQNSLSSLNADYRRILMITGSTPDIYRDYGYENLIPEVLENFVNQRKALQSAAATLNERTAVKGDFTNSINKLIIILQKIEKDPEMISELFATFKDNLSSLGTWIQNILAQPLDVDRFYIVASGEEIPKASNGFFSDLFFKIKMFLMSFGEDYQSFAADITEEDYRSGNVVTVWMTNGREQCQIVQKMTEQHFTPAEKIKVNMQLVAATALLPASLAGVGPDVAMNVPSSTPINFAIRGAAVDLSQFSTFVDVTKRFHDAALVPFEFENKVYAIPETMTFLMMFYRTDIFEELGLKAPETWDEFYEVVWELQQQNLDVGYPINAKTSVVNNNNLYGLELFLYQNGGSLYNKEFTASAMTEDLNIECFEKMAELFTLYKFPVDYDFANRFRSGEMPLGIVEYTMYNQLTIFASEIKGLWAMTPVPGTVGKDGSMNNISPAASSGIMMLKSASDYEKAWRFIDWFTTADMQSRYAIEVESVLGAAAKQATSNLEAMESMSWTKKEFDALSEQIKNLRGTPEIPGGYYTARAIDFAFANVYAGGKNSSASILSQAEKINEEITRKRKEFGLE